MLASKATCNCGRMCHSPGTWRNQKCGLPWAATENGHASGPQYRSVGDYHFGAYWTFFAEKERYCIINNTCLSEMAGSTASCGHYYPQVGGYTTMACGRSYCDGSFTTTFCQYGGFWASKSPGPRPYNINLDSGRGRVYPARDISVARDPKNVWPQLDPYDKIDQWNFCLWPKGTSRKVKKPLTDQVPSQQVGSESSLGTYTLVATGIAMVIILTLQMWLALN